MLLKNGTVYDAVNREPYQADVAVREGVIAAIGPNLQPQAGEEVIDCAGKRLYPGFVDAHSHLGLEIGTDGGDDALPQSDVRLVGLPIDSVVYRTVFQKHVTSLPSKNICL